MLVFGWSKKQEMSLSGETFTNCAQYMDLQPDEVVKFLSRFSPSKFSFADPALVQTGTQQYMGCYITNVETERAYDQHLGQGLSTFLKRCFAH